MFGSAVFSGDGDGQASSYAGGRVGGETELMLKAEESFPIRLLQSGFVFEFPPGARQQRISVQERNGTSNRPLTRFRNHRAKSSTFGVSRSCWPDDWRWRDRWSS